MRINEDAELEEYYDINQSDSAYRIKEIPPWWPVSPQTRSVLYYLLFTQDISLRPLNRLRRWADRTAVKTTPIMRLLEEQPKRLQ